MPDTTLQLGDFVFDGFEIPEQITFGGDQAQKVHKLVGGQKVVDAMGWFPKSLTWSGRFRGPNGRDRALYVQGLFRAGAQLTVTWDRLNYIVAPESFECDFARFYELPYKLTLEVVSDATAPVTTAPAVTVDDQVNSDMDDAETAGDAVGDDGLTSALSGVSSAIANVSTFVGATSAEINSVLGPIADAQATVQGLIATANATIAGVSTFGGVVAGGSPAALAASITAQAGAMADLASLGGVSDLLTRMSVNLQADGASGAVLTLAGGSLMDVAARAYGDPSEWVTLAQANGLTDPMLTGITTLRVPATRAGTDGVPSY